MQSVEIVLLILNFELVLGYDYAVQNYLSAGLSGNPQLPVSRVTTKTTG